MEDVEYSGGGPPPMPGVQHDPTSSQVGRGAAEGLKIRPVPGAQHSSSLGRFGQAAPEDMHVLPAPKGAPQQMGLQEANLPKRSLVGSSDLLQQVLGAVQGPKKLFLGAP